ncbi:hypothetical protein PHYBOEH_001037 [Phytophthora boehmeriae]|uniref:Uncharacterized protein n=1 Tax=Phytophthora boehmeriae TaxID=109152 RepID=A0A8T1X5M7_9STRA|nr:hypothetical protein PHYBOEH_001037 [Phytophthora boehmeriae]
MQFRRMVVTTYRGDVDALRPVFHPDLRGLQISRATYLDICMQEKNQLETLTDSLEREELQNALQDEKMEFFAAVEQGRLALGDTLLHIAVRLGHTEVVDFLLLTNHETPQKVSGTAVTASTSHQVVWAPLPTNTPNFKGELPRDVIGDNCSLQLLLATVDDVQEVFGATYRDEPKVHRLVRSLRRIWPLWMFEGQHEAASLVRVLYDVRSSDAAFGGLHSMMAISTKPGKSWQKDGLLSANLRNSLEYSSDGFRYGKLLADDLRLFGPPTEHGKSKSSGVEGIEPPDAAGLKRYDNQVWQQRISPPPASIGDLCVHIDALEGFLKLPHLAA